MEAPKYEAPPPDPTVTALQQNADAANQRAMQDQARQTQSSLMARYGTRLALAGVSTGAPIVAGSL